MMDREELFVNCGPRIAGGSSADLQGQSQTISVDFEDLRSWLKVMQLVDLDRVFLL